MGIELESEDEKNSYENVELNALHAAILKYPQMLNDVHVQKTMKSALLSARKEAQGCKLILDGFWSYICPDLFAFCQWLFLGQDVPDGLIPEGYIYNHYYDCTDIKETCCLRYPHLSDCEHGIRKVMQSEECKEWFIGTDTIVSSHDLISKALQADWDGDHICLVHDKTFVNVLDRKKYPLFYDMTKAEPAQISDDAIMMCLISSFHNENIGFVSNAITKIFNSETEPNTKLVRILCAYNNFVIDYFKTQKSMDLKGKITPATIDKWFGGKITAKALDRLEKYKYIKREQRERYDKIYLCDIPTEEASEAQFMAESFNPLLDLWESNGDRKVGKCEICGKKFVVVGNSKTCSDKCSKILVKKNKNKQ